MKSFGSMILEMSIAILGDWKEDESNFELNSYSKFVAEKKWDKLATLTILRKEYQLRKLRTQNEFILGRFEQHHSINSSELEERFVVICQISTSRQHSIETELKKLNQEYRRIININGIYIDEKFRGIGLATLLYKWLVNEQNFVVMGDSQQYFGARRLWSKLSRQNDVIVDLIDISENKILDQGVILHHGETEKDFDERLWSMFPDVSKRNIRPILRRIN